MSYFGVGQFMEARACLEESLAIGRELVDRFVVIRSSSYLGLIEYVDGGVLEAIAYLEESVEMARDAGMKGNIIQNLHHLGDIASYQGDYPKAHAFFQESLGLILETEDSGSWFHLHVLLSEGFAFIQQDETARAREIFKESFILRHSFIGEPWSNARLLIAAAGISASNGYSDRAARWLGIAQALIEVGSFTIGKWWWYPNYEHILTLTRAQLDEDTFNRLNQEGRAAVVEVLEPLLLEALESL